MPTITVQLNQKSYQIRIGSGLLNQIGTFLVDMGFKEKAVIITNPTVSTLYGDILNSSLKEAGFRTVMITIPEGENFKSLEQSAQVYEQLSDYQSERMTPVLALGGGVIGDLTGFVASTYMRGVPLIHLPTTLLAQVDSSIGGKTAVNHKKLKNMIGTFYQPTLVVADTSILKTLPDMELKNGLAEVIKYGIIRDKNLFEMVKNGYQSVEEIIWRCGKIKSEIVEKDEKDLGLRNILNYGHTIGHALETASNYEIKHGQGVAIGMVAAACISQRMGVLSEDDYLNIRTLIAKVGLPVSIQGLSTTEILQAMQHDKKKTAGRIQFILPKTIGEVFIKEDVTLEIVKQTLKELYAET